MASELLQSEAIGSSFRLDPRTKLILMLLVNAVAFSGVPLVLASLTAFLPILLLVLYGKPRQALYAALIFALSAAGAVLLVPRLHGLLNILIGMVVGSVYRLMPGFIMGYCLVAATGVSEFIAAMERLRAPAFLTIPLSVMFRFFPTLAEESRCISDAMRMRGLGFGKGAMLKRPAEMLEYRLVPLLMSAVKIGDELSAASLTRGLGGPVRRTHICRIGFGIADAVLLLASVLLFVFLLMLRRTP